MAYRRRQANPAPQIAFIIIGGLIGIGSGLFIIDVMKKYQHDTAVANLPPVKAEQPVRPEPVVLPPAPPIRQRITNPTPPAPPVMPAGKQLAEPSNDPIDEPVQEIVWDGPAKPMLAEHLEAIEQAPRPEPEPTLPVFESKGHTFTNWSIVRILNKYEVLVLDTDENKNYRAMANDLPEDYRRQFYILKEQYEQRIAAERMKDSRNRRARNNAKRAAQLRLQNEHISTHQRAARTGGR